MARRERGAIAGDILAALDDDTPPGERRLTQLAETTRVPYDRLLAYLDDLAAAGLLRDPKKPRITAKGREYLQHYRDWVAIVERYGIGERRGHHARTKKDD